MEVTSIKLNRNCTLSLLYLPLYKSIVNLFCKCRGTIQQYLLLNYIKLPLEQVVLSGLNQHLTSIHAGVLRANPNSHPGFYLIYCILNISFPIWPNWRPPGDPPKPKPTPLLWVSSGPVSLKAGGPTPKDEPPDLGSDLKPLIQTESCSPSH